MKRAVLAAFAALFLVAGPVSAVTPPPGLAGDLTITAKDGSSVTLLVTQTGGDPVTFNVWHYCYDAAGNSIGSGVKARAQSGDSVTFSFVLRKGVPASCKAHLEYPMQSATLLILDVEQTYP